MPGIINIHPADTRLYQGEHGYEFALGLLKKYPNRLAETKITVHFVDKGVDTGPIIRQVAVPVLPGDTIDELRERGLASEYVLYSEVIQLFAEDRVKLQGREVIIL